MTDVSIEAVYGPMDSFLLNSVFGFQGPFPSGALGIVFISEFLRLLAPAVFQGVSFVLSLVPVPRFWSEDYNIEGASGSDLSSDPVIIPDKYTTFHDDRKAKKGGDNDLYMLQKHGFDKYRHLSKPFMKRNRIVAGTAGTPQKVGEKKSKSKSKSKKSKSKSNGK